MELLGLRRWDPAVQDNIAVAETWDHSNLDSG